MKYQYGSPSKPNFEKILITCLYHKILSLGNNIGYITRLILSSRKSDLENIRDKLR